METKQFIAAFVFLIFLSFLAPTFTIAQDDTTECFSVTGAGTSGANQSPYSFSPTDVNNANGSGFPGFVSPDGNWILWNNGSADLLSNYPSFGGTYYYSGTLNDFNETTWSVDSGAGPAPTVTRVICPGGSSPFSLDGHSHGEFSSPDASGTVELSTLLTNDVIVLEEFNETNGGTLATVSSVSDTAGLSWHLRAATSTQVLISNGNTTPADMEVWYAISSTPLSSDIITVTLNNTTDDGSLVAFGVNGANLSSPWDSNSSAPAGSIQIAPGNPPNLTAVPSVSGVSTNANDVMLLGFEGSGYNAQPGASTTDGYNDISYSVNLGAANYSSAEAEYKILSTAASNTTISFGSAIGDWFMIGDAIQAASSGGSTPPGRIIRLIGGLRLLGGVRLE